jgi:hypothetical protein
MSVFKYTSEWIKAIGMARAQLTGKTAVETGQANYKANAKVGPRGAAAQLAWGDCWWMLLCAAA